VRPPFLRCVTRYVGIPRLVRATGEEPFDTVADGVAVIEHPEPGEAVWRDDARWSSVSDGYLVPLVG
jgi:DNA/RNA-binding domain of Phe-tRNA-synthetase-like protein